MLIAIYRFDKLYIKYMGDARVFRIYLETGRVWLRIEVGVGILVWEAKGHLGR